MVNITTVEPPVSNGEVFAGIDWGGAFHQICLIDQHGQVLHQQRVHHDVGGFAELDPLLRNVSGR